MKGRHSDIVPLNPVLCASRKHLYQPMEGDCEFQRAAGSKTPRFQKESINWTFQRDWQGKGVKLEKPVLEGYGYTCILDLYDTI